MDRNPAAVRLWGKLVHSAFVYAGNDLAALQKVAGRISTQLCGGSTLDTIKQTIRQASDILQDGTNAAGKNCDAISIGIGFTGKRIGDLKTEAKDAVPPPDPCAAGDGGADGGQ